MINKNKMVPLLIAILLVIVGLGGFVMSMAKPNTIASKQTVTVGNYEQEGTFDYKAYMDPAYYYGNYQDIPSSPDIPLQSISTLAMNYQYNSPDNQVEVAVDAVLENPDNWQKVVSIIPKEPEPGNFTISFPIDVNSFQTMATQIEKEMGTNFTSHNINVIVTVYGEDNTVFTHTLTINMPETYIVIGNTLVQTQGESTGIFSYSVALADNPLYGTTTISSPTITMDTAPVVLGPSDTAFTKLIESMDCTYVYNITSDETLQPTETVTIDAVLENPGVWAKTFVLVPTTQETGNFTLNFPLEMSQYVSLINNIEQQTGVSALTSYNLTLQANVDLTAQTSVGTVNQTFSDSIATNLTIGVLSWTGDLQQSQKGTITTTSNVQTPTKIWGIKVVLFRVISIVLLVIGLALLVLLFLVPAKKVDEQAILQQKALETEQKYKNLIISVNKLPEHLGAESVLAVSSLDELIKVAQALLKPINHVVDGKNDIYWITDGVSCYQYQVTGEPSYGDEGNEGS